MKIGGKIGLSFLITTLLITIATGFAFYTLEKKDLELTIFSHLNTAAKSKAQQIETSLEMYKQTASLLAEEHIFKDLLRTEKESPEFNDRLKRAKQRISNVEELYPGISYVSLCNRNGRVLISTNNAYIGANKIKEEIFLQGKKGSFIADLRIPAQKEVPILEAAAPVTAAKKMLGVIIMGISPPKLFKILSDRSGLRETGELYLVNRDGYMISPSRFEKDTRTILKKKVGLEKDSSKSGMVKDYRGTMVLRSCENINSMKWQLLAKIDSKEALGPLLQLKIFIAGLVFLASFLAWLIGISIAKIISSPIHKLGEGIEEIGHGNLDYKANINTNDEIDKLSCAIEAMAGRLKASTTPIDTFKREMNVRKQMEKKIEGSGKRLEAIFDMVRHISFVMTDLTENEPHILEFSPGAERIFGYKKEEVLGKSVAMLHQAEDAAKFGDKFKLLQQNKEGTTSESTLIRSSGEKFAARLTSYPIFDDKGNLSAALDVACDITEEEKEKSALQEYKDITQNYLESVGVMLLILDKNNRISFINKRGREILGYKEGSYKGKNWVDFFLPENKKDKVRAIYEKLVNGEVGQLAYLEYPVLTASDNEQIIAWHNTALIKNEKNNNISIICTGKEITEQTEREQGNAVQLKEETEYKEQKVIKASEATDTSQIKSHFLAKMSREIKAPMNDIMRSGAILKNSLSLEENQKKYVETITKNSESILALINDVLDISKIAENEIKIEEIDFDLEYLVQSILTLLKPKVQDKPVALYSTFEADMPTSFKGDPTRIRQVILHLLRNAIRFTEKGEITINIGFDTSDKKPADGATESIRALRIMIKDTGLGISKDKQKIIHDIFNQTDMAMTTQYEVRWVGLTVTKHLIEMMGGSIRLESEEGKGSKFIFTLRVKETLPITASQITPLHKNELQDKRIAVIEDFENPRRILDSYCKELGMKMLFYASSTNEALQMLDKESELPDIILCDITMAGMDGCEVTKKIKENERYKNIKLVAISSYNIPGAAKITQALGFNAYLPKPIVKEDLIKVILTTLGDKREGGQIITRHMYEELALKGMKVLVSEDNAVNQKGMEKLLKKLGCEIGMEWNGKEASDRSEAQQYDLILMDIDRPEMNWREAVKIIHKNSNREIPIIALTSKSITALNDEGKSLPQEINDYLHKPVSVQSLKEKLLKWGNREE